MWGEAEARRGRGNDDKADRVVLQVVTRLNVGGVTDQVITIARELQARGVRVVLVSGYSAGAEGDLAPTAKAAGIPIVRIKALANAAGPAGDLIAIAQLYRTFREQRPTIVHAHMFKARVLGGAAAVLAGVPLVETLHGNVLKGYYGRLRTRIILTAERLVGRRLARAVIVPSEHQLGDVRRFSIAPREKVVIHRYGINLCPFLRSESYAGQTRRELGIPANAVVCAVIGRLVQIKGLSFFLQAIEMVVRQAPAPVYALVVGDGELRSSLEAECVTRGIAERCRFLGWRTDLDIIYGDVDIVVLGSLNEGTPVSVIEAMAAGRAIVATAVGGVPDMLTDGVSGTLVPAADPYGLAGAILRLANDPDTRSRLGTEARRRALADYTTDALIERTLQLYNRVSRARDRQEECELKRSTGSSDP